MTAAVLPLIRTLRMSRGQATIAVGLIMWVAGGVIPVLLPNPLMGATQRFIHGIEILTQTALLGITTVMLLCRKQAGGRDFALAAPAHSRATP